MEEPTQDLSKFSYENLLQFAKDSQTNNDYQQHVIEGLQAKVSMLEQRPRDRRRSIRDLEDRIEKLTK